MKILTRSKASLLLVLLVATLWRAWLIQTEKVAFSSDEAIVGLMARHILQGEPIPTFYYGQAYMGSLDAILTAGGFWLFGESIQSMRVVQAVLYFCILLTSYTLVYRMTSRHKTALITMLLLSLPSMMGTLYTTITLGGYNEMVLCSTLVLLLGWQVTVENSMQAWHWALLGLVAGIGWWVNGAIITALLLVGLMGLRYFSITRWRLYLLAVIMFMVGSAPWWWYNLHHDWAALAFLTNRETLPGVEPLSPLEKIVGFIIVGLTSLYGFRFPWEVKLQVGILAILALLVYILLATRLVARIYQRLRYHQALAVSEAARWVWLGFGMMFIIFMLSGFQDTTGRYLMPIWVFSAIGLALALADIRWQLSTIMLVILLVFHSEAIWRTIHAKAGIEPQLIADLSTAPEYDTAVLNFMREHDYQYGYTSYWVSYRLMFKSHEQVIFDTSLPYRSHGYVAHNNRYQPYVDQVARAARVVWITHSLPELDALIVDLLAQANITYQTQDFGPYHIYYDFSARIAPADFELNSTLPLATIRTRLLGE